MTFTRRMQKASPAALAFSRSPKCSPACSLNGATPLLWRALTLNTHLPQVHTIFYWTVKYVKRSPKCSPACSLNGATPLLWRTLTHLNSLLQQKSNPFSHYFHACSSRSPACSLSGAMPLLWRAPSPAHSLWQQTRTVQSHGREGIPAARMLTKA